MTEHEKAVIVVVNRLDHAAKGTWTPGTFEWTTRDVETFCGINLKQVVIVDQPVRDAFVSRTRVDHGDNISCVDCYTAWLAQRLVNA